MKQHPAIAALEFSDIPAGVSLTDAMLKKASIAFFKCGTITRGRYLTLVGGTTGSVQESVDEALRGAGAALVDVVVLPDVHPRLYEAVQGVRRWRGGGSLAVVETGSASASIRAAEAALKGTPIELVEIRLGDSGLAGKGVALYAGDLYDIEAGVALATTPLAGSGVGVSSRIIPAPHDALLTQLEHGTAFANALLVELDGEMV
jgi:microcompartment protein CcmL/EutN